MDGELKKCGGFDMTDGALRETAASEERKGVTLPHAIHDHGIGDPVPGVADPDCEIYSIEDYSRRIVPEKRSATFQEEEHDDEDDDDQEENEVSNLRLKLQRKLRKKNSLNPGSHTHFFPEAGIFGEDAATLKQRIRLRAQKYEYNVKDFYKEEGWPQKVARSTWFEYVTLAVIGLNALWIWIDADYNKASSLQESDLGFQFVEHFFCAFFFCEWLVRYASFKETKYALRDMWFLFDSALVLLMVLETWVVSIIVAISSGSSSSTDLGNVTVLRLMRLLRLTRVSRLARLLRALPELLFMIKGMLAATRSVLLTMMLLVFIIYVFAILCRQLSDGKPVGKLYFKSVPYSMYTLWIHGTLLDNLAQVVGDIKEEDTVLLITFFAVILLAALTLMNMLIGVLCEVVSNVASAEREELSISFVRQKTMQVFNSAGVDKNKDGKISKDEFADLVLNDQAIEALEEVGVEIEALVDYAELIFQSDSEGAKFDRNLEFNEFMDLVLQLRGSNTATVKDISDLRRFIHGQNTERNRALNRIDDRLLDLDARMHLLQGKQTRMEKKLDLLCETLCPDKLETLKSSPNNKINDNKRDKVNFT